MGRRKTVKIKTGRGGVVYTGKRCKCGGRIRFDKNRSELYCERCGMLWGRWAKRGIGVSIVPFGQLRREYHNYWGMWNEEEEGIVVVG